MRKNNESDFGEHALREFRALLHKAQSLPVEQVELIADGTGTPACSVSYSAAWATPLSISSQRYCGSTG